MSDSFATCCAVAHQASLSLGFSRQEYWSRLPFPFPGDFPDTEIKPMSPALAGGFFTTVPPGKAQGSITMNKASGGNGIPAELFKILIDDAVKVMHSICQQI